MLEYLVESALLTHGLNSISKNELLCLWPKDDEKIAWMEKGQLTVGGMRDFLKFREEANICGRVNYLNYEDYVIQKESGPLTASGTMKACEKTGVPLAVTCGMGGLMTGQGKKDCHDIQALAASEVRLIATAPKDMFDLAWTIVVMEREGIEILGKDLDMCDGYIFVRQPVKISGRFSACNPMKGRLLLNGIPRDRRMSDQDILEQACAFAGGYEEEWQFHPAVNQRIDELTDGQSSRLQFHSLLGNVEWARQMKG